MRIARPVAGVRLRVLFALAVLAAGFAQAGPQARTVRDDSGTVLTLGAPPQRIISLAPNITEILFALGLGDRVIGVTRYCDYPAEALTRAKVGGFIDPDVERIRSLNPDLVIAYRGNPWNAIRRMRMLNVVVFVLDIGSRLEAVPETIEKIGRVTQKDAEARALAAALARKYQTVIEALTPADDRPRVFLNLHGMELLTCGQSSYLDDLIGRAKGTNIAGRLRRDWVQYGREQLIKDNPEIIVVLAPSAASFAAARDWFKSRPEFDSIRAVKDGRIGHLDENMASRFGPRLYDAFADLARLIHPECFPIK